MRVLINWILWACWLRVIFGNSSDAMSADHTSHFLFPLLRWLFPGISKEAMDWIHFFIRKGAHMSEYAILYLLSWRVFHGTGTPVWKWRRAAGALLFVALFAASDEYHQSFVPSREASVRDVLIDVTGASLALLCIWRWKRRHQDKARANEARTV